MGVRMGLGLKHTALGRWKGHAHVLSRLVAVSLTWCITGKQGIVDAIHDTFFVDAGSGRSETYDGVLAALDEGSRLLTSDGDCACCNRCLSKA